VVAVFVFALTLFLAVLVSDLAERSILSTAVMFLAAGILAGNAGFGLVRLEAAAPVVSETATLALFSTLYTDGMRVGIRQLAASWRLPGRALLLGLPLSIVATAVLAHLLAGLEWRWAFLLGAVLAPTDPVFAAALVQQRGIPEGLRQLLNVESGVNDGLALPVVLALIHVGQSESGAVELVTPLLTGIAIGILVPWVGDRLERARWFGANQSFRAQAGFAVGLLVFSLARLLGANELLAAFAAGMTVISLRPQISQEFRGFAENLANLLKFAGVFIFGALLSPSLLSDLGWSDYLFAALALVAVRPLTLSVALLGSGMDLRERRVAAWFGPKGFASVLYAVFLLRAQVPSAEHLFHLAAVVITASMVLHSSTDVLAARWLRNHGGSPQDSPGRSPTTPASPRGAAPAQ
jgi:sodium/hydrogen antiporter